MSQKIEAIRAQIEEVYRSGKVRGEDGVDYPIENTSVTPERGHFLADLCRAERAKATLEIGMAWGLSTLFILEALAANGALQGAHVVADPFQSSRWHGSGLRSIREAGAVEMIEFYEEPSEILLPRMLEQKRVFDFAFIDGNHRFDAVFVDVVFVDRLLRPGGVMVLDDSWFDAVHLAGQFAETNLRYEPIAEFPPIDGQGDGYRGTHRRPLLRAYRKPRIAAQRDIFHFVPFFDGIESTAAAEERRLREEGTIALAAGDGARARRAFLDALQMNPRRIDNWMRVLRTFVPRRRAPAASRPSSGVDPAREIR
jgi:predicted O-methyltransferase YrrM